MRKYENKRSDPKAFQEYLKALGDDDEGDPPPPSRPYPVEQGVALTIIFETRSARMTAEPGFLDRLRCFKGVVLYAKMAIG